MAEGGQERLSRSVLALFAAPCLGLAGIGLPLTVYLPTFYSAELGLGLGAVGMAFMTVRLIDIGLDPLLGVLMDRTRTRFGRFRPWLAAGTPLLMLASGLLFFARPGVTTGYLIAGLALAYGGWSICVLAQTAWGSLLSPLYDERSRVYGWWQAFNLTGLLAILLLPVAANAIDPGPATGIRAMGGYLIVLLPLSAAMAVLFVKEPAPDAGAPMASMADWPKIMRSSAVRRILIADVLIGLAFGVEASLFLFFFTRAKGFSSGFSNIALLLYFIGALAGGPIWTWLAVRVSKHMALAWSCVAGIGGLAILGLLPNHQTLLGCIAALLATAGARLDHILVAPDAPWAATPRRKPGNGMLREAMSHFQVAPAQAVFIGDSLSDLQAAASAGCHRMLVRTGHGRDTQAAGLPRDVLPVGVHETLADAVEALLTA